jgi:formate/nitrite transporter FocA (FNT family)
VIRNLIPVTVGNIFGGAVLVGAVYWFVYLRRKRSAASPYVEHEHLS